MSIGSRQTRLSFFCLLFICILNQFACGDGVVSSDSKDRFGTPENGPHLVVGLGESKCSICHSKSTSVAGDELPAEVRGRGNDGWILGDELLTWYNNDFHYQAFRVLQNDLSRQMAKRLGIVDSNGESAVHQDRRCLSCHSSMPVNQMALDGDRVANDTTTDSRYANGVSCEGCHGPAGRTNNGSPGWDEAHVIDTRWRTMHPKTKFEEFGYWDIRSPRTQTRICLSCHMGNVEQKKVITHEMYAAGHPPLPSFELSQFVHQMPRHWRRLEEKPKALRDAVVEKLSQYRDEGEVALIGDTELAATKMTMISALVTLEESMGLTADLIADPSASQQWPELANYSCFACHHELSRDGWRKKTRLSKFPGRPSLHEWPFALSRVVAQDFQNPDSETGFQRDVDAVISAMTARPYGDPTQLKLTARSLAKTIEAETKRLSSTTIDRDRATRFLTKLASAASTESTDYDSARQFVWAYERTFDALNKPELSNDVASIQEKMKSPQKWIGGHPILDEFVQELVLWLRANRTNEPPVKLGSNKDAFQHSQRSTNVSESLKKISEYNPQKTSERFQRLLKSPVDQTEQTR